MEYFVGISIDNEVTNNTRWIVQFVNFIAINSIWKFDFFDTRWNMLC